MYELNAGASLYGGASARLSRKLVLICPKGLAYYGQSCYGNGGQDNSRQGNREVCAGIRPYSPLRPTALRRGGGRKGRFCYPKKALTDKRRS